MYDEYVDGVIPEGDPRHVWLNIFVNILKETNVRSLNILLTFVITYMSLSKAKIVFQNIELVA